MMNLSVVRLPSSVILGMISLHLQKRLDGFTLELALDAPEEKIIVLFGPSGAGKSLTLGAIAGFLTPDAGRIAIGARVLFDSARGINLPPQARQVGMVRQDLALFPHLTAAENIAYGLFRASRAERERVAREFLEMMQLDGLGARKPAELSGGQQQRVALARALAIRPALLLLDEPFSALDRAIRMELRDELKSLHARLKTTLLFVTHDLGEAYFLADYLAVIEQGRVLQFDTPAQILRAPQTTRVARMMGVRNILPGVVTAPGLVRVGERELQVDTRTFAPGSRVFLCIRPERINLVRPERLQPGLANVVQGVITGESNDGANIMLWLRLHGARLLPQQPYDLQIEVPVYVYERLALAQQREWHLVIKHRATHLVAE